MIGITILEVRVIEGGDDKTIRLTWREGADTLEIAQTLGVKEWMVANRLPHARSNKC